MKENKKLKVVLLAVANIFIVLSMVISMGPLEDIKDKLDGVYFQALETLEYYGQYQTDKTFAVIINSQIQMLKEINPSSSGIEYLEEQEGYKIMGAIQHLSLWSDGHKLSDEEIQEMENYNITKLRDDLETAEGICEACTDSGQSMVEVLSKDWNDLEAERSSLRDLAMIFLVIGMLLNGGVAIMEILDEPETKSDKSIPLPDKPEKSA